MADFKKIFKPTKEQEFEQYKKMLAIHKSQIGHCTTCLRYAPSTMPGFVTDYGECLSCMVEKEEFTKRVVSSFDEASLNPCEFYVEDTARTSMIEQAIRKLEESIQADELTKMRDILMDASAVTYEAEGSMKPVTGSPYLEAFVPYGHRITVDFNKLAKALWDHGYRLVKGEGNES